MEHTLGGRGRGQGHPERGNPRSWPLLLESCSRDPVGLNTHKFPAPIQVAEVASLESYYGRSRSFRNRSIPFHSAVAARGIFCAAWDGLASSDKRLCSRQSVALADKASQKL